MLQKKSQLFMLDLIFSFVVIIVAVGIALSYTTSSFEEENLFELNTEILQQYTATSVNSLNNEEIRDFFLTNKITNVENSIAQQTAQFYTNGNADDAETLVEVFIESYERRNFDIEIAVINETDELIPYRSPNTIPIEDSKTSYINSREILFSQSNQIHTFTIEVRIWQ